MILYCGFGEKMKIPINNLINQVKKVNYILMIIGFYVFSIYKFLYTSTFFSAILFTFYFDFYSFIYFWLPMICIALYVNNILVELKNKKSVVNSVVISILLFLLSNLIYRSNFNFKDCYVYFCLSCCFFMGKTHKTLCFYLKYIMLLFMLVTGLSLLGLIENNRGNSFGIIYRTDCAAHLLFIVLTIAFLKNGNFSWKGELLLLLCMLCNYLFIGGKTAGGCFLLLLFVTLYRHYLKEEKIPFQNENKLIRLLFFILYLPIILFEKIKNRLIIKNINKKIAVEKFGVYVFLIFAFITISLTLMVRGFPEPVRIVLGKFSTIFNRLTLGNYAFREYGVNLFGHNIPAFGAGNREGFTYFYFFLDIFYVKTLLENGILGLLLFLLLTTLIQYRLYKRKMYYRMFLIALVALDGAMEHHLWDISYNPFLLLAFADLDSPETDVRPVNWYRVLLIVFSVIGLVLGFGGGLPLSTGFYSAFSVVLLSLGICITGVSLFLFFRDIFGAPRIKLSNNIKLSLVLCSLVLTVSGLFSAYRITTYRGWEPAYNSTMILSGEQLDHIKSDLFMDNRISTASRYLNRHEESNCIICCGEKNDYVKERLMEFGIDASRVFVLEDTADLNDLLLKSDKLIKENGLGERKTVVAFKIQKRRISDLAKRNKMVVSVAETELPWQMYLYTFFNEQILYLLRGL